MNLSLEWPDLTDFLQRLQGIPNAALKAAGGGLYREGEDVIGEAKELAPVDLGTMRDSGHVEPPVFDGNEVNVTVGFGGASQDYVVEQHENESYFHDDGEAKFLEKPLLRRADGMGERIAAEVAHAIGEGGQA